MGKTILFTPVGGTDPISNVNAHDGAMLHICRYYRPDTVIMYMSKEILGLQEEDDRYRYCLNRLFEKTGKKADIEIERREELADVHDFDYFYEDFGKLLREIIRTRIGETDTLLINVSSGTPAMKSALTVLNTINEYPCRMIQVATPEKKMNQHDHTGYDVKMLWELNGDNQEDAVNRCKEITCRTLTVIREEGYIRKMLLAYDYNAAYQLAEMLPERHTVEYMDLLRLAKARYMLDTKTTDQMIRSTGYQCIPVRGGRERNIFEYALNLDIKRKRGEYADFIRGISPIVADLFEMILKEKCKIKIDDYCTSSNGIKKWDETKLKGTELLDVLSKEYETKGGFRYGVVYSDALRALIDHFAADTHVKKTVDELREVESKIRNLAAHEIVTLDEGVIRKRTEFTDSQIMWKIQTLIGFTSARVSADAWQSYDAMNAHIIEKMSGSVKQ